MAKIVKHGERLALLLPTEIDAKEGEELALYELRHGVYVLSRKGGAIGRELVDDERAEKVESSAGAGGRARRREDELDEASLNVLRKLESINFSIRTPKKVAELMSAADRRILDALVEQKIVSFFKSAKYKEGVYNIPDRIYALIRKQAGAAAIAGATSIPAKPATPNASARPAVPADPEAALELLGYTIIERENDAKLLSEKMAKQIKSGEIMGVRGFDRRFYLARKGFYVATSERIEKALRGGKARSVDEIARDAKLRADECEAVLNIMREQGEVVEKKKGTYELA